MILFYYGAMLGNGGGISQIELPYGELAAAYSVEVGSFSTEIGSLTKQVLDLQWSDVEVAKSHFLNFWLALGRLPEASEEKYRKTEGSLYGARYRYQGDWGYNDIALVYGHSLLSNMQLPGLVNVQIDISDSHRWRIVEHWTYERKAQWGFQFAADYENWCEIGIASEGVWKSLGIRPYYIISRHIHLVWELGLSEIQEKAQPLRTLRRITFVPQWSLDASVWGRPPLRFYITQSFWNQANRVQVSKAAPSFANKLTGAAMGLQAEVWF